MTKLQRQRAIRKSNRQKGLCFCGRPRDGSYSHCSRCRKQNRNSNDKHFFRTRATMLNWNCGSDITALQLARLWHQQRGQCALSGERLSRHTAHLDHIIPRGKGGPTVISNLRWLHAIVNHAKWDSMDEEFLAFCQKVVAHATKS